MAKPSYANDSRVHPYVVYAGCVNAENCPPEGTAFLPRTTRWHELELIVRGNGGRIVTAGTAVEALKGRLLYRRPGTRVQGIAPYHSYFILFDMAADPERSALYERKGMEQLYGDEPPGDRRQSGPPDGFPLLADLRDDDEWEAVCKALYREFADTGGENQLFLKTAVLRLLLRLRQEAEAPARGTASPHYAAVMAAKSEIDRDPAAALRLGELARRAGMSRSLFGREFAGTVGAPPMAYAGRARLRLAKELLLQSGGSVQEIAGRCGFDNVSYFYRSFKRATGMTPQQFRAKTGVSLSGP